MNNNRLKTIDLNLFFNLDNMVRLHLESNKLISFDRKFLYQLENIEQVCLYNNVHLPANELNVCKKKANCVVKILEPC